MTKQQVSQRIKRLKKVINYHRYLYHVLNKQEISDSVLDSLKKELYQLEQQYPELITYDSPTQRVAGEPLKGFKKVKHQIPMLSIEDIASEQELKNWQNYLQRLIPAEQIDWFCELKIDGLACSLIYENGLFKYGVTRGNGLIGEDVTQNLKTINSIPLKLQFYKPLDSKFKHIEKIIKNLIRKGRIEIRGEVYMDSKTFKKVNQERQEKGEKLYANPRNIAAGSIRQLDSKLTDSRQLNFLAYAIMTDLGQENHNQEHQILKALGLPIAEPFKHCKTLEEIMVFQRQIVRQRKNLLFQIDGIVISVNNNFIFQKLGITGKSPRGVRAFKFVAKEAITQIEDIKVQIGRTGAITPIAKLKPISIAGSNITRATLHNEDEIKRLGIKIGDTVIVARAGDVIPAIKKVLPEFRTGKEKRFIMPIQCPSCNFLLKRPSGEKIWRCPNLNCYTLRRKFLEHFVSKKAFDINGLGPKIIDKLLEANLISGPKDLFRLKIGDIIYLQDFPRKFCFQGRNSIIQGFAEKSAANLISAIQKSKKISLNRFIYALGIRYLGEETAIDLASYFQTFIQLQKASQLELENIFSIGKKTANSIEQWFQSEKNQKFIRDLLEVGIEIKDEQRQISSTASRSTVQKLKGKIFVLTGILKTMTRIQAKEKIRSLKGKVSESVSSKTDYIIVGKEPGLKYEKAKKFGVKIITEKYFLKMINNS